MTTRDALKAWLLANVPDLREVFTDLGALQEDMLPAAALSYERTEDGELGFGTFVEQYRVAFIPNVRGTDPEERLAEVFGMDSAFVAAIGGVERDDPAWNHIEASFAERDPNIGASSYTVRVHVD